MTNMTEVRLDMIERKNIEDIRKELKVTNALNVLVKAKEANLISPNAYTQALTEFVQMYFGKGILD